MQKNIPVSRAAWLAGLFLSAATGFAAAIAPTDNRTWTLLAPLPFGRHAQAAATGTDGLVYVLGGSTSTALLNNVDVYLPAENRWTSAPPLPVALESATAIGGLDGRIYILGGVATRPGSADTMELDTAFAYDPRTRAWSELPRLARPCTGAGAVADVDGRILVFGGSNHDDGPLDLVQSYDPRTNQWTLRGRMPTPRLTEARLGAGRKVYFIGGSGGAGPLTSVEIYDLATDTWTSGAPMPTARVAPTIALGRDNRLYVIGGLKRPATVGGGTVVPVPGSGPVSPPPAGGSEEITPVDIYDPRLDAWSTGPALTAGRHSLASATLPDGRILAIGGWSGGGGATPITQHAIVEALLTGPEADGSTRFANISARGQVGAGANALVIGFVVAGSTPRALLLRGVGPTLSQLGVTGALADPQLAVFDATGALLGQNNDWGGAPAMARAFAQAGTFALPATSKDAAILLKLPPGAYTIEVSGVAGTTGIALVEAYELP